MATRHGHADRDLAGYQIVGPSYFRRSSEFPCSRDAGSPTDTAESPQVSVVDEEFVRRFLSGRAVLGTRLSINAMVIPPRAISREIVGVVGQ